MKGRDLRVLHLINDLKDDGGAQRVVSDLAAGMAVHGVETRILTLQSPSARDIRIEDDGVERIPGLRNPAQWARGWRAIRAADVIHVHLFPSLYLGAAFPGCKVFTEHGTTNRRRLQPGLRRVDRQAYRRFKYLVCVSDGGRRALSDWLQDRDDIRVIPNGVDLSRFSRRERDTFRVPSRIGMVASFNLNKDQDTIIRAMASLPEMRAVLAGDGPSLETARQLAGELGVTDRVEFPGRVAAHEMQGFMDDLDLYVQSSHSEAFGLAAVEAMASGLPVIGSDVPGLNETIGTPEFLIPHQDHVLLARKLKDLVESPKVYARASAASVKRAGEFDRDLTTQAYLRLYEEAARR